MTPIIITLSLMIHFQLGRKNSGTDLGTGYGGAVCGFPSYSFIPDPELRGYECRMRLPVLSKS